MALTATLSTPLTTVPAEYQVQAHITISNSGGAAVTVKQIRPQIKSTPITFAEDKSSFSASVLGASGTVVPAGGSTQVLMQINFHGSNRTNTTNVPTYTTYDVGCVIYGADGEVVAATPITMTVTQNTGGK